MEKMYLFFDGSAVFRLRKRFYTIAGIVGTLDKLKGVVSSVESKFGKINKKERSEKALSVSSLLLRSICDTFMVYISCYDSRFSTITKELLINAVSADNVDEVGELGLRGRFWAQSQWIPVQKLKETFIPVIWMDREEEQITRICKTHFTRQTSGIPDAFFGIQHDDTPSDFNETYLEKFLTLSDFVAYCFMRGFNGENKMFPTIYGPFSNEFLKIHLMRIVQSQEGFKLLTSEVHRIRDLRGPTKINDIKTYFEERDGQYYLTELLPGTGTTETENV